MAYHSGKETTQERPAALSNATFGGMKPKIMDMSEPPRSSQASPRASPIVLPKLASGKISPAPSLGSNSHKKIRQLTGHDVSEISSMSRASSMSAYSQSENESERKAKDSVEQRSNKPTQKPAPEIMGDTYLKSTTYHAGDKKKGRALPDPPAPPTPPKKDSARFAKFSAPLTTPSTSVPRTNSNEPLTMRQMLEETRKQYDEKNKVTAQYSTNMNDPYLQHLVPPPLTLRPKNVQVEGVNDENITTSPTKKKSALLSSFHAGIDAITSPTSRNKPPTIPEHGVMSPPPPLRQKHKRDINPSSSPSHSQTSDREQSGHRPFGRKFSLRSMKRLSGGKISPRQTIISNAARKSDGPDTPVLVSDSSRHGGLRMSFPGEVIQSGNEHFQEVYARAKKSLRIKSADEKRRESIKKKISVVGVADQSPGEYLLTGLSGNEGEVTDCV